MTPERGILALECVCGGRKSAEKRLTGSGAATTLMATSIRAAIFGEGL